MSTSVRVKVVAGLVAVGLALGACSSRSTTPTARPGGPSHRTSYPSRPSGIMASRARPDHHQVEAAVTTVRRYLHAWAAEGPSAASRYLVSSERVTSDQGASRIKVGTLRSYRLYRWQGPRVFTLLMSLGLRFTGNPIAWSRGLNDRFVTVRRSGRRDEYVLEFGTGP